MKAFKDNKELDKIYLILLMLDDFNLFPEMIDIFGKDKIMKFLTVFSGVTIKVPDKDLLEKTARDIHIFTCLKEARLFKKIPVMNVIAALSKEYNLSEFALKEIYKSVLNKLEKYDIDLIE